MHKIFPRYAKEHWHYEAEQYAREHWPHGAEHYNRECWPYNADTKLITKYANWLRQFPWTFFCTFTFPGKVSDARAINAFKEFIDRLEESIRCDVAYVRGDEKRFSGCGKPACGRHFHALMTCAASPSPWFVEWVWTSTVGNANNHAGALVVPYDSAKNGAAYVLKFINQADGDWDLRKLYLFHPDASSLQDTNCRMRRVLRRHRARVEHFQHQTPTGLSPA